MSDSIPSFFLSPRTRSPVCPCLSESPQWAPIMKPSLAAPGFTRLRPDRTTCPREPSPARQHAPRASAQGGQGHIVALDAVLPVLAGGPQAMYVKLTPAGGIMDGSVSPCVVASGGARHARHSKTLDFHLFPFLLCTQENVNAPRESGCDPKWGCN